MEIRFMGVNVSVMFQTTPGTQSGGLQAVWVNTYWHFNDLTSKIPLNI